MRSTGQDGRWAAGLHTHKDTHAHIQGHTQVHTHEHTHTWTHIQLLTVVTSWGGEKQPVNSVFMFGFKERIAVLHCFVKKS